MKKMKLIGIIAALFLVSFVQADAQKMGYLNSQELFNLMPESKKADSDLQALQTQLKKEGDQKLAAIEAMYADMTKRQEAGTITGKDLAELQAKIEEERQKILAFEQEAQGKLLQKQEELLAPILKKANEAIKVVAEANGYSMVFDTSTGILLHFEESDNLLSLVKTQLGI